MAALDQQKSQPVRNGPGRARLGAWLVAVGLLIAALLGGLGYFQYYLKPALIRNAIAKAPQPPVTVTAEPAKTETWTTLLRSIGTLVAVPGIDVSFQVGGIVSAIDFENGQEVEAGAPLLKLDDAVERADLASNEATLKQADLDLARQQDLARRGVASRQTFEAAQAKRDTAAAAVAKSRVLVSQKNITAPFAGRLGIRKVDVGQYVAPGAAVVSLQALDPIFVDFTMPEQQLSEVKVGDGVKLAFDALPANMFQGMISVLDARLDPSTHSQLVRARVRNPEHRLLPGMFADVTVLTTKPMSVVTVPRTAIAYSLYGDSIFVVRQAGSAASGSTHGATGAGTAGHAPTGALIAERRPVKLGITRGDRVAIASGVVAGEQVATSGQNKLQPDSPIRVDNASRLEPSAERPRE